VLFCDIRAMSEAHGGRDDEDFEGTTGGSGASPGGMFDEVYRQSQHMQVQHMGMSKRRR